MKRLFALLLAIALLVPFAACGTSSPSEKPAGSNHTASSETAENTEVSEEITRAISYGLVPETLQGDYGKTVTFSQYCEMLTNLIRLWDEDRVNEWEELIALAAASDEEMRREDGILATAYAMVLMEKNAPGDFFHLDIDEISKQLDSNGDTPPGTIRCSRHGRKRGSSGATATICGRGHHLRHFDLPRQRQSHLPLRF